MPETGFYGVVYNYFYSTDRLNDDNGNKISSVTIKPGPGPGTVVNINVDLNVYALAPTFIWVSKWKLLGAKYGAYISPSFSNTSIGASLSTATGSGRSKEGSQFAVADLYVQPLWLGWAKKRTGTLHLVMVFMLQLENTIQRQSHCRWSDHLQAEAADNIGLGYWTHQLQGAASYYPWARQTNGDSNCIDLRDPWKQKRFRSQTRAESNI